jgi:hypothetical protein
MASAALDPLACLQGRVRGTAGPVTVLEPPFVGRASTLYWGKDHETGRQTATRLAR